MLTLSFVDIDPELNSGQRRLFFGRLRAQFSKSFYVHRQSELKRDSVG